MVTQRMLAAEKREKSFIKKKEKMNKNEKKQKKPKIK